MTDVEKLICGLTTLQAYGAQNAYPYTKETMLRIHCSEPVPADVTRGLAEWGFVRDDDDRVFLWG